MDRKICGETVKGQIPPQNRSREGNAFTETMLAEAKAKRLADIEARLAADDARRIRVLRAWGPLYYLAGRRQAPEKEAAPWEVWAARILDTVAALKAEDLFGHLDNINTGDGTNARSRAAKCAVEVYRLAIDGDPEPVSKSIADAMRDQSPTSKSRISQEYFEEMLRCRIVMAVFAAEWCQFTLADLERELERLGMKGRRHQRGGLDRRPR